MAEVATAGRRLSVAETLEQARKALQTHRSWMKKRSLAINPEESVEGDTSHYQVDLGIFTRDKSQPLLLEDASPPTRKLEEASLAEAPAPPPSLDRTTPRRRSGKVAPASLDTLPELPLAENSLTAAPLHFYGSTQLQEPEEVALFPTDTAGRATDSAKKKPPSNQRKRHAASSKGRVVPVTKASSVENGMARPTSPTAAFYSQQLDEEAPPTQTNGKHPRTKHSDIPTPTSTGPTEDQGTRKLVSTTDAHQIHTPITEHIPSSSSSTERTGLSSSGSEETGLSSSGSEETGLSSGSEDKSDHNESSDLDMSKSHFESLRGESSSFIVPVSPAPRDQRSSYSAHTLSKVRAVEESLQIISKEAEEKMAALVTDTTPSAFRLPITEHLTSKRSEVEEVENVFMRRVLPKVEEKSEEMETVTHHEIPTRPAAVDSSQTDNRPLVQTSRVDQGGLSTSGVHQGGVEDIETVDLFAASPGAGETLSESNTQPVHNVTEAPPTRRTSPPVKRGNPTPSTTKKSSSSCLPVNKSSPPLTATKKNSVKGSRGPKLRENPVSLKTEPGSHGDLTVKMGDGAHLLVLSGQQRSEQGSPAGGTKEEERLRELKLPPLRMPRVKSIDGNEMVRRLPSIKSPLTPYTTGFTFSTKRERAPPPYTIHRPQGSLGLAPPCPPYGVAQPKALSDLSLTLTDGPTRQDSSHFDTLPETNKGLVIKPKLPTEELPSPSSAKENIDPNAPERDHESTVSGSAVTTGLPNVSTMPAGPGPLHFAAKSGNLRRLQALINQGHDVDLPDQNGQTPLMFCIHTTGVHLSCADALIREGANVNKQSSDGSAAMHLASSVGGVALIELMILNGARTDVRDFEGRLPIHWAAMQKKSSKVIAVLLENSELGVDVTDDAGMTPLMWAAYNNNAMVTSLLLERGADREEKDDDGYTAMHWAVHKEGTQCLELLLKPDMTYFKDHKGKTVIQFAAEKGAMTACEVILKMRGDTIFDTDKMGRTPLHYAAACSCVDVCALLLDRGADASQRDTTGRTPLDYARLKKLDYVVALLTCHGTAVADFARASRSTSVSSFLNRSISFGQLSGVGGSAASLASLTSEGRARGPVSSVSSHTQTTNMRPTSADSVRSVRGEGVDVVKGGYLGRFVNDKTDPIKHYYFRLHPDWGTISWTAERGDSTRTANQVTVLEVHEGPSNTVKQASCYSPEELHKYVFWIMTAGGVLDLLAYNQDDYSVWVREARRVAMTNEHLRDTGQALRRQQRIKDSGVPSRPSTSQSRTRVAPTSLVEEAQGMSEGSGDIAQSANKSKLFLASNNRVVSSPASMPVREDRSGQFTKSRSRVGITPSDDHVTSHMTGIPAGFRSDIFMTSTPKVTPNELVNDII